MSTDNEVYNEVEVFDLPNEAKVQHNNYKTLFKHEDPYKFQMYDVPRVQMDSNAKFIVMNSINLLKNIWWCNQWFCPKAWMRGATSNNVIF